jgi:site-specific recombinase XerD
VELYFADWSSVAQLGIAGLNRPESPAVTDATPIIVDDTMRPVEPLCGFLRMYSENVSENSVKAYARDILRFAKFLNESGSTVLQAKRSDLVGYRENRLSSGLSMRSWARELVPIRVLFQYLLETGQRTDLPWIRVGSRSLVNPKLTKTDLDVRALSHEQWLAFRNIGLGGELPSGQIDNAYRGRCTVRNTAAAEFALTTGMRLREWSTVLDFEVPASANAVNLALQSCAKNGRFRRVYVPVSTVQLLDTYRRTEREAAVRRAQKLLRQQLAQLAVATDIDISAGRITYTLEGRSHRSKLAVIPPKVRRILVKTAEDGWIEPLSLFIGNTGKPPSLRRWHEYFKCANDRLASMGFGPPAVPDAVTTHDLRHTFAVVMLRGLQEIAARIEASRPRTGTGTISEHIIHNPLLTLQRLLGHASPSSTMVYLRYIDDSDELIQRAFESWSESERDYASYVLEQIEREKDYERPLR